MVPRPQAEDEAGDDESAGSSLQQFWAGAPKQSILIGVVAGGVLGVLLALFVLSLLKEKQNVYDPALLEPVPVLLPRPMTTATKR